MDKPETGPTGNNPTIATYIQENGIQESKVEEGTPGAPQLGLPVPEGWEPAGDKTPDNAYGAIVYQGADASDPPPRIIAIFSKLAGNVDPQQILDLAPGELTTFPASRRPEVPRAHSVNIRPTNSAAPTRPRTCLRSSSRRPW